MMETKVVIIPERHKQNKHIWPTGIPLGLLYHLVKYITSEERLTDPVGAGTKMQQAIDSEKKPIPGLNIALAKMKEEKNV